MPIADADHIQEQTSLSDEAVLAAKRRLRRAERWVRQRVGDDTYTTAVNATDQDSATKPYSDDTLLREDVKDAEALYAASRALHNHQLGSGGEAGFLRVVQVDGEQSERKMSQQELDAYAENLEEEARAAIARHLSAASDPLTTTMQRATDWPSFDT